MMFRAFLDICNSNQIVDLHTVPNDWSADISLYCVTSNDVPSRAKNPESSSYWSAAPTGEASLKQVIGSLVFAYQPVQNSFSRFLLLSLPPLQQYTNHTLYATTYPSNTQHRKNVRPRRRDLSGDLRAARRHRGRVRGD